MTGHFPNRRDALLSIAGAAAFTALPFPAAAQSRARLVIVGGGFGGATAARFLKRALPAASVTLIEPNADYYACPFSNLVIAGLRDMSAQRFGYDALRAEGIDIVKDLAVDVDAARPNGHGQIRNHLPIRQTRPVPRNRFSLGRD